MDKFNGEDPYGLLKGIDGIYNGNERMLLTHRAWDRWDDIYGVGKLDYEVYALCDKHDPGKYVYGESGSPQLKLNYRPHYIGHGQAGKRCIDSAGDGRQRDKSGEKYYWIEQMARKGRDVHIESIGMYYTKKKALMVEIKLLTLMKKYGVYLTNATYTWTQVPLNENDFDNPVSAMFFD